MLYGKPDLPDGVVSYLLGLPEEQRGVPEHILKEFKSVFPADLPKHVPPDRGLRNVHKISIILAQSPLPARCITIISSDSS